jgi:ABC-type polar amino acid transport system ATPase subunit
LGPSACGKTTLIKCLIGLITIDEGKIQVHNDLKPSNSKGNFNLKLKKLGFMSQVTIQHQINQTSNIKPKNLFQL